MWSALSALFLAAPCARHAWAAPPAGSLRGGLLPKVDPDTWTVWEPPADFKEQFDSWAQPARIPDEIRVWCKGFIPKNVTEDTVQGRSVLPITLPGGLPLPGYYGQCAVTDGRDWTVSPFTAERPDDSRFAARLAVRARGGPGAVDSSAKCGFSHNVCCKTGGCYGSSYGNVTCGPLHCPDELMQVRRLRCWTSESVQRSGWTPDGEPCENNANGDILAVKAYFYGRGGDPCVKPLGVPAPPATWDIGVVLYPTKRRVRLAGFVDDAPATECYAQTRDGDSWGPAVTLAQLPHTPGPLPMTLVGFSDRPLNPSNVTVDIPASAAVSAPAVANLVV